MINSTLKSANILIVDDKQSNIDVLTGFLDDEGYTNYISTTDPRKVIGLFEEFKPDLILLDLHMPHLNGFSVMAQLKALIPEDVYLPILVLTADATTETKLKALAAGAKDFLSKPFDLTEVELRIRNLLLTRSMNIQLKNQNLILEEKVEERTIELNKTIVELSAAKEKAEESDKLKTAFINNISHEIRTPLNSILGFSQLLAEEKLSAEERSEFFDHVEQSGNRLINTITDFMDMAMIFSGTMKNQKKEFLLEQIFKEIKGRTDRLCADKNIDFNTEIPIESVGLTIFSNPELLQKILNKLLDNALKFTCNGSITCGYKIKAGYIEFFVRDTGIGIESNKLDLIFKMFVQEDASITRGYEGSGLGLSIANGLLNLIGGKIFVVSEKGKGSKFTFTIPFNNSEKYISDDETNKTKSNEKLPE